MLCAVSPHPLPEIAEPMHQRDSDHRHAQIRKRAKHVSGKHPKPAAVGPQLLVQRHLHGEIGDAADAPTLGRWIADALVVALEADLEQNASTSPPRTTDSACAASTGIPHIGSIPPSWRALVLPARRHHPGSQGRGRTTSHRLTWRRRRSAREPIKSPLDSIAASATQNGTMMCNLATI